ncbi:MAG: ABC transporter permease [Kordiimonadaceae bacterium]|nr:ABC transporter permease [Kordiimonadaceae bacterium]
MKNPLSIIGSVILAALSELGRLSVFSATAISHMVRPPLYWRLIAQQMWFIGYNSLPVVGLTALFTGAALAQQIFIGGSRFNAESVVPGVVVIAIVRELGPVLGGLMVAGRVSSAMAAELGTMRVTEQIDALVTLSTDPFKYLITPRLIAAVITLPLLILVANTLGVLGGYIIGTERLDLNGTTYLQVTIDFMKAADVYSSLVKAAVFGFFIALMGSYHGYNSRGGAQGVGKATTNAVVSAFIAILISNLVITVIVFGGAS